MRDGFNGNNNNLIDKYMKNKLLIIFLVILLNSCYEDYVKDFDYDSIYIPIQTDVRTFVVGEGMKFNIGVELGGVRKNDRDRIVSFQVDNSLINASALEKLKGGAAYIGSACASVTNLQPLPANYFTLSNKSQFIIKKGDHNGIITIRPDSTKFLSDPATLDPNYALGIKVTSADADSLIYNKKTAIIGVKFENMLFGNYWHGGVTTVKDPTDATVVNTIKYYTQIPVADVKVWSLKTVSPNTLTSNGYSDLTSPTGAEFILTLKGGTISISPSPNGKFSIQPDGESSFNQAKLLQNRKIFLKYKYQDASGNWCHAQDTLTFRNRIRDGVNEWQDENPSNYK